MTKAIEDKIIAELENTLFIDNPPIIDQAKFDLIVDKLIKKDGKETMWRLCGTYEGYNYNKVIDYYVKQRNSYYIEELVCITDGELDQEYLVAKMIETKDKDFIRLALETCGNSMQYSMNNKLLEELLTYIKTG